MPDKAHSDCIKLLGESQEAESDSREAVREADHFLNKRDGQWEPEIISKFSGKPRYTFDECNPIVDDIMGEMEEMDFDIRVSPSGGDASKDIATAYEGIIRNIENISGARFIYNAAARIMVGTGMSAWRVVQAYRDDDSFQQDLLIEAIPNVEDSVWFDANSVKQDRSDSEYAWVLSSMTKKAYEEKYPKGSGLSVGSDRSTQVYSNKKVNEVIVGEYLYKKRFERELALLSNGAVVEVDEEFEQSYSILSSKGITIQNTRKRPYHVVYQRVFDGDDWLSSSQETVFEYVPIIPCYGNFRISENKIIYWGIVEKLMDPQRVINYAESRKIEEGALSPRGKVWMTKSQAKSIDVIQTLRTLNVNNNPVQFYDWAEGQGAPTFMGSPVSNPGLVESSASAQNFIQRTSGTFDEARGTAPAHRSGVAIDKLQEKSDNPKRKWYTPIEISLTHTANIVRKAIPKVYTTQQEMRMINQDGSQDTITIRQKVVGEDGNVVEINDLSKGKYDVIVKAGPGFRSRQQETVTAINEIAAIDPTVMALGSDILLNNINSPGIDKIAERKRLQMIQQGLIPMSQLNEEEKRMYQQIQQENANKEDPMAIAAKAEAARVEGENTERMMRLQLEQMKLQQKEMELKFKSQIESMKLDTQRQKQMVDTLSAMSEQVKTQAEALKTIREAIGVDGIVDPEALKAFKNQAMELNDTVIQQQQLT